MKNIPQNRNLGNIRTRNSSCHQVVKSSTHQVIKQSCHHAIDSSCHHVAKRCHKMPKITMYRLCLCHCLCLCLIVIRDATEGWKGFSGVGSRPSQTIITIYRALDRGEGDQSIKLCWEISVGLDIVFIRSDLFLLGKFKKFTWGPVLIKVNNTITDGGVASPPLLLTIVMCSSNSKSLRISRNSKDSREGYDRIVGSARSAFAPAALRLILIISL